jgi:hypothetical protein
MDESKVVGIRGATAREWNHVVELDLIVANGVSTLLADLAIAADNLEHDFSRYDPSMCTQVLRLSQRLRDEIDGTDMAKDPALCALQDLGYRLWVGSGVEFRDRLLEPTPPTLVKGSTVRHFAGCEAALQIVVVTRSRFPGQREQRKVLYEGTIGAVLQFPAGLADETNPFTPVGENSWGGGFRAISERYLDC